jgi:glycosyl transferase family 25
MHIAVISLTRATGRRAAMCAEFAAAGLAFEFLDAVDASTLHLSDVALDRREYTLNARRGPIPGEIACYLSHVAAWRRCIELGERLVVLEDDAKLGARFAAALQTVERLPSCFGYIRLESAERARTLPKGWRPGTRRLLAAGDFELAYVSDVPLCMLAYAIRPETAAALIEASETIVAPVDKFIQRTWVHRQPIFALRAPQVTCRPDAVQSCIGARPRKTRSPRVVLQRALYKAAGELHRLRFDAEQLRMLRQPTGISAARREGLT